MTTVHRAVRSSHVALIRLVSEQEADGVIEECNEYIAPDQARTMKCEKFKPLMLTH